MSATIYLRPDYHDTSVPVVSALRSSLRPFLASQVCLVTGGHAMWGEISKTCLRVENRPDDELFPEDFIDEAEWDEATKDLESNRIVLSGQLVAAMERVLNPENFSLQSYATLAFLRSLHPNVRILASVR